VTAARDSRHLGSSALARPTGNALLNSSVLPASDGGTGCRSPDSDPQKYEDTRAATAKQ